MLYRVTIHHEGAGEPADTDRESFGGYTYGIGPAGFRRFRSPYVSWATLGFNHVSVDICLTGNRDLFPVSDADIAAIGAACADARGRGELAANPIVVPHRYSPGSNTDCPGVLTMERWNDIMRACAVAPGTPGAPQPPDVHPVLRAGDHGSAVALLQHRLDVGCGYHLAVDGAFGPLTLSAVRGFQAFFRLAVDGIVGPQTWGMVDYCYAAAGGR